MSSNLYSFLEELWNDFIEALCMMHAWLGLASNRNHFLVPLAICRFSEDPRHARLS